MKKQYSVPKSTWAEIKKEYLTGNVSMRELARKYSLSVSTISEHAKHERWRELAEQAKRVAEQKMIEKVAESQASNAELAQQIINTLMRKIAQSAELIDPTDTTATRQITQCMKDLKEMDVYGLETDAKNVNISFAEGMSEYAD